MVLSALSLEGIVGVWGVCGETGFPGEDAGDIEVPATIGGTLDNCRLDELDERCRYNEECIEFDKASFESFMRWNLLRAALVRLVEASLAAWSFEVLKLFKSFFWSSIFKKSEILSSSVCIEPELAPPTSARTPDPG